MRKVLIVISIIGIILTVVPAFLVLTGVLSLEENKNLMLLGTVFWFVSAPYWLNRNEGIEEAQD